MPRSNCAVSRTSAALAQILLRKRYGVQPKLLPLGKHGGLVVHRSILEMKHQPARHAGAARGLQQVPIRQRRPLEIAEDEKAAHEALGMTNGDGLAE